MSVLAVGLGGAVGAILRFLLGQVVPKLGSGFPLATFAVNVLGCFAIGAVGGLAGRQSGLDPRLVLFLQTGICGGFTTFSTFSLETLSLIENGKLAGALAYLALSIVRGILALLLAKHLVSGWE